MLAAADIGALLALISEQIVSVAEKSSNIDGNKIYNVTAFYGNSPFLYRKTTV